MGDRLGTLGAVGIIFLLSFDLFSAHGLTHFSNLRRNEQRTTPFFVTTLIDWPLIPQSSGGVTSLTLAISFFFFFSHTVKKKSK